MVDTRTLIMGEDRNRDVNYIHNDYSSWSIVELNRDWIDQTGLNPRRPGFYSNIITILEQEFCTTMNLSQFIQPESIFSKTVEHYLDIVIFLCCGFTVSILGMLVNIVNMIIYYRYGLKIGMNMVFFSLSFSDFIVASLFCSGISNYLVFKLDPDNRVDHKSLGYLLTGSPRAMFLGISSFTTGFLSLERCVCVVRPLKVKVLFTRRRCCFILIAIYGINLALYLPIHTSAGMEWQFDPFANRTRLLLKMYFSRHTIEIVSDVVNGALVPSALHVIVISTGIVLVSGLKRSNNFRQMASKVSPTRATTVYTVHSKDESLQVTMTHVGLKSNNSQENKKESCMQSSNVEVNGSFRNWTTDENQNSRGNGARNMTQGDKSVKFHELSISAPQEMTSMTYATGQKGKENTNTRRRISRKDTGLVKMVAILVALHIVCITPGLIFSFARISIQDLDVGTKYDYLHNLLYCSTFLVEGINGVANTFVYFNISSKYREIFLKTFSYC